MPQLLSRRDETGWLTPSMADILKAVTSPLAGEDPIRSQITEIERGLAEADAPVRIVDVRPTPSRLLYIARPEVVGRRSGRRPVNNAEIRRGLSTLSDRHRDWQIGFIPQLEDEAGQVGIIVRTEDQGPLHLRQVIVGNTFLGYTSTLALILGVTIDQHLVVRGLDDLGNLLVVGPDNTRQHFVRQTLLSLLMLNTPSEIRLALMGTTSQAYQVLLDTPHTLGRMVYDPQSGIRLLDGMLKEAERRRGWFGEQDIDEIGGYNEQLLSGGEAPLPRIVLLFDGMDNPDWHAVSAEWSPQIYDLLLNGPRVGIHLLLTSSSYADGSIPDNVLEVAEQRLVMRAVDPTIADELTNFHQSLLRFIDAFFIERDQAPLPIEMCSASDDDLKRLVSYWKQVANKRSRSSVPAKSSGLTDLLPSLGDDQRPATTVRMRPRTQAGMLARATRALSADEESDILARAGALAAYLGWLGVGPLRDIFGISTGEARALLIALQDLGVLEDGDAPVLRFVRLAENPLADD